METVQRMRLVGGNLALDFVNTRSGPPDGPADDDVLTGHPELVAWGVYAGALTAHEATALDRTRGTRAAFARARRTRDYLDDLFRGVAAGRDPDADLLARLGDDAAEALAHATLEPAYVWSWRGDRTPARPLRPVVHAAVELLTAGPLDRVKACGGCRFLFLDESKNRSRRWCSMDDCGTAEKIRRYVDNRRARAAT
ncbi:CGNR zinc finger domain-containing protein [Asanoa sp. WMMD1127]|uniref:CGNR zinc finger domain-containing protein n=1 Tax=Asanoa sp. WMMD1127 TaxID=3016107 RepID=UPI002415DA54|nr:ABATE domain-containing protein [Asanoa sp. WMMD1127]MDG4825378.1 CGNR zinc finger domain-containing protein [Asanoa sp. WMMD1127]